MFVAALSSNEDNTCWQKAHWPVALCVCMRVCDGVDEIQKIHKPRDSDSEVTPSVTCTAFSVTFPLKHSFSSSSFFLLVFTSVSYSPALFFLTKINIFVFGLLLVRVFLW